MPVSEPFNDRSPPAAIAAALKIAAGLPESKTRRRRLITASTRPSMGYGRASRRSEHRICGVQRGKLEGG